MLNNLLKLKWAVGKEKEFLGKVHVMPIKLTLETLEILGY